MGIFELVRLVRLAPHRDCAKLVADLLEE